MRKGIWQEFDGYDEIVAEIDASRISGTEYTSEMAETRRFIHRLHPSRLHLRVNDVLQETPSTKTFRLVSRDGVLPPFQAGQYLALYLKVGNIRTSRPYSISSPPHHRGYYDITVRRVEKGLVSNFLLDEIKPGDEMDSSGPEGTFVHNPVIHPKTIIGVAGGSGITPFMSMIRQIAECGLDRNFYLFHGSRDAGDMIFRDALTGFAARFENIHYIPVIENPAADYDGTCGLITADVIQKVIGDPEDKVFFLCGPQGLYDFCLPELEKMRVPGRCVRQELYGPPLDITDYPGWPETVTADRLFTIKTKGFDPFQAPAGVPLLTSLEKAEILIPALCRSGECSRCRVKVVAGNVFQPEGVPVRRSDKKFGYIHACVSYPVEDLELLL